MDYPKSPNQPIEKCVTNSDGEMAASGSLENSLEITQNPQDLPSNPQQIDMNYLNEFAIPSTSSGVHMDYLNEFEIPSTSSGVHMDHLNEFAIPSTSFEVHIPKGIPASQTCCPTFDQVQKKDRRDKNEKSLTCECCYSKVEMLVYTHSEESSEVVALFCEMCYWIFAAKKPNAVQECQQCHQFNWRNVVLRNKTVKKKCNICYPKNIMKCISCFLPYPTIGFFHKVPSEDSSDVVVDMCEECHWNFGLRVDKNAEICTKCSRINWRFVMTKDKEKVKRCNNCVNKSTSDKYKHTTHEFEMCPKCKKYDMREILFGDETKEKRCNLCDPPTNPNDLNSKQSSQPKKGKKLRKDCEVKCPQCQIIFTIPECCEEK